MKKIVYVILTSFYLFFILIPLYFLKEKTVFNFKNNTIYIHENIINFDSEKNNWNNYIPSDTEILLTYYFDDLFYDDGFKSESEFQYFSLKYDDLSNLYYETETNYIVKNQKIIILDSKNGILTNKDIIIENSIILSNNDFLLSGNTENSFYIKNSVLNFNLNNFLRYDISNSSVTFENSNLSYSQFYTSEIYNNFEIILPPVYENSFNIHSGYYDQINSWITI